MLTPGGFAVLGNSFKSDAITWIWETTPLMGNVAT